VVTGDYGRCRQLLLILLDNAVKFSPVGETVTVSQLRQGKGWKFVVADHGCGIAPDKIKHIFTKFHRSHDENNKQGTGLGLAIAWEIAQRHGWQLSCVSQLGKGSKFIISQS
jgi:signal transduction histidine kinase